MSDYTTQLRFICESYANLKQSAPSASVDEIIEAARPKIFDFNYPIFDENYKRDLETKIIQHYYTQEIGLETVGLWKLKLRTKMREIMPYYNKLYSSELLQFNPFINTDYTDNRSTTGSDTKGSVSNTTGSSKVETDNVTDNTLNSNGSFTENSEGSHTGVVNVSGSDSNAKTGTETTTKTGTETTTKTGTDKTDFNPMSDRATLVKHSDTPMGGVSGVTADGSNYLSDVTETVDNYNGGNKKDETTVTHNTTDTLTHNTTDTLTHNTLDSGTHSEETETTESSEESKTGSNTNAEAGHTVFDGEVNETNSSRTVFDEEGTNQTDYAGRILGKTGSETYSEMLLKFRETFLNIDMQVIDELNDLFMLIW